MPFYPDDFEQLQDDAEEFARRAANGDDVAARALATTTLVLQDHGLLRRPSPVWPEAIDPRVDAVSPRNIRFGLAS